jgi:hypothetical protein
MMFSIKIGADSSNVVIQCFKTLTEMVRGPCLANQTAIVNSKFLEFSVKVLSEDHRIFQTTPTPIYNRTELESPLNIHPGLIGKLKFYCLQTIVSLLEGNEFNDTIILLIMR